MPEVHFQWFTLSSMHDMCMLVKTGSVSTSLRILKKPMAAGYCLNHDSPVSLQEVRTQSKYTHTLRRDTEYVLSLNSEYATL